MKMADGAGYCIEFLHAGCQTNEICYNECLAKYGKPKTAYGYCLTDPQNHVSCDCLIVC